MDKLRVVMELFLNASRHIVIYHKRCFRIYFRETIGLKKRYAQKTEKNY